MVDHTHWPETLSFIKRNWFWLSSAGVVAYYTIKWSIIQVGSNILRHHPTYGDLQNCQKRVTDIFTQDLKNYERITATRFDRVEQQQHELFELNRKEFQDVTRNLSHTVERVEDKINMIISKLLDKSSQ